MSRYRARGGHTPAGQRCTIEIYSGEFCDGSRAPDMPFPICADHAIRLYRRMREMIEEAHSQGLMQPLVLDQILTEMRAETNNAQCRVYYIQVGDLIKIGYTARSVKDRLRAYPPGSELLAVERGGTTVEAQRHHQFRHLLAERKEWFRPGADLLDHIATLATAA
jgi:hypothetical protein